MTTDWDEPMSERELRDLWTQLQESFVAGENTDDIEMWMDAYYAGRHHLIELLRLLWTESKA